MCTLEKFLRTCDPLKQGSQQSRGKQDKDTKIKETRSLIGEK